MAFRKILVTGSTGMLGRELIQYLEAKGYSVLGVDSSQLNLLETMDSLRQKIEPLALGELDMIIHTAAMTDVDRAEKEPELAMAINKDGSRKMATIARDLDAIFLQVSTDYVFDGRKREPYAVSDRPNPVNTYGWSKYYGELMVKEVLDTYYIMRTSWLYGVYRRNFVQFVVDAASQGRKVHIVDDQYGAPTWTGSLCQMIEQVMTSGAYGTYHACDRGEVSRYEQAVAICKSAGLSTQHIAPIAAKDFPQAAKRPVYTVMDPEELAVPNWETSMNAYLEQYLNSPPGVVRE